jgi:hypothetical protein
MNMPSGRLQETENELPWSVKETRRDNGVRFLVATIRGTGTRTLCNIRICKQ